MDKYNKKKILCLVLHNKNDLKISRRTLSFIEYFKSITSKNDKFYLIDLTNFFLGSIEKKKIKIEDKKIIYFKPKNFSELNTFVKNKNIFAIGPVFCNLNTLLIFIIMKYFKFKLVIISFFGYFLNENNENFKLKEKVFIFRRKFNYYFSRILMALNIIPKIDLYFESSQERIDELQFSKSNKLDNYLGLKIFSTYKKIIRINSKYYDEEILGKKKNNLESNKYLVLIDSGLLHPDGLEKDADRYKYDDKFVYDHYEKVFIFLKSLSKLTSKKIIFCKHPKTLYPKKIFNKYKNSIKFLRADTAIWKADYVIFTGGTSMFNKAILLKKKIIFLKSIQTPKYDLRLINSINKLFPINIINIDNKKYELEKMKVNFNLNNYKKFINKNLIYNLNLNSVDLIRKEIFK